MYVCIFSSQLKTTAALKQTWFLCMRLGFLVLTIQYIHYVYLLLDSMCAYETCVPLIVYLTSKGSVGVFFLCWRQRATPEPPPQSLPQLLLQALKHLPLFSPPLPFPAPVSPLCLCHSSISSFISSSTGWRFPRLCSKQGVCLSPRPILEQRLTLWGRSWAA